jgi:hypothetical protein
MTAVMSTALAADDVTVLVGKIITFFETNEAPDGLFADDLFLDYTSPLWRLQAGTREGAVALRRAGHSSPGRVARSRVDVTTTGFVMEFEEVWDEAGDHWYAREMVRADIRDGRIAELSVYCTGDWDSARVAEHAKQVRLIRP